MSVPDEGKRASQSFTSIIDGWPYVTPTLQRGAKHSAEGLWAAKSEYSPLIKNDTDDPQTSSELNVLLHRFCTVQTEVLRLHNRTSSITAMPSAEKRDAPCG